MYGIRLARHDLGLLELAQYTMHLPPGCALWQSIGGPLAWTPETHLLNLIEFQERVANWRQSKDGQANRNKPKMHKPPEFAADKAAEQSRETARAEAWAARQALRATT